MSNAALTEIGSPAATRPAPPLNEDWLAVIVGLFIFVLGLAAVVHIDDAGSSGGASIAADVADRPRAKAGRIHGFHRGEGRRDHRHLGA